MAYEWLIGIGIAFGLAGIMSYLTYKDILSFMVWFTVFIGFMAWTGYLPLWILVVCFIIDFAIVFFTLKRSD